MKKFLALLISIIALIPSLTLAQDYDIDEFFDHLPYQEVIAVTNVGNMMYAATPYSVFTYDKDDNSLERLTKVQGLNDIDISWMEYNSSVEAMVIGYENTNIDIIKDQDIINIADIKRKTILGNKTINKIFMKDQYAYIACGFGIVVIDLDREEVYDTYKIGPDGSYIDVKDLTYYPEDNHFYAATEIGIYRADADSPNLANYIYWELDTTLVSPDATYNQIVSHEGFLVTNKDMDQYLQDTLFMKKDGAWSKVEITNHNEVNSMRSLNGGLYIAHSYATFIYDDEMNYVDKLYRYDDENNVNSNDIWLDTDSSFWIADANIGLVHTFSNYASDRIETYVPSGPAYSYSFDMASFDNEVWVASGGYNTTWGGAGLRAGLYYYKDGIWYSKNQDTDEIFDTIPNIICVAVEPGTGSKKYFGTWSKGLLEITGEEITNLYNADNSSLQGNVADDKLVQISGLAFDDDNNLWVVNNGAENILSMMTPAGEWYSFSLGSETVGAYTKSLLIDDYNQKWVLLRDQKIAVFHDNDTPGNSADDLVEILTSSAGNGAIPGESAVYAIAKDLNGNIWIGTDQGVGVIYSPENVFTGDSYDAEQPKVEVDGYVQYLLSSEVVTAIEVDGGGNLWFGTQSGGIFQMSSDGTEELKYFTEDDSPLFSDEITTIEINDQGYVFIGTSKGIISYKGSATPGRENNKDIYIYPNPVKSGYEGLISIINLVSEANVKITDISGNLVYETTAEGGSATWNGRNFDGVKVSTGYYLVFVTNDDGSETIVSKILVLK